MKYIDADKLIAEIERRIAQWQTYTFACASQIASEAFDRIDELKGLLIYITSLQQEPRFPQYNNIVDKVFGAGNLEGFEYHEAEMLVALAKEELLKSLQQEQTPTEREIAEAHRYTEMIRERDKARIQQEHPEVELEIERIVQAEEKFMNFQAKHQLIGYVARHFYELGLNARKEE